ncbi:MAG: hypothetical protein Q7U35_12355, partial [Methanobacteriaceae archaeon]|nr:hypothetical protein [Methanobacteriaceae archaeon]MDP3624575.1 hypothetical protein [Methanobacteriaceae archaeon]
IMPEITPEVIFKKESGETVSLLEKFVRLQSRAGGLLTVNFRAPEEEMINIKEFFKLFQNDELVKIDIGGTGDINCSFKGISPILEHKDETGFPYFSLSVTLKDQAKLNQPDEPPSCGCG